jgi:hypothetical protein
MFRHRQKILLLKKVRFPSRFLQKIHTFVHDCELNDVLAMIDLIQPIDDLPNTTSTGARPPKSSDAKTKKVSLFAQRMRLADDATQTSSPSRTDSTALTSVLPIVETVIENTPDDSSTAATNNSNEKRFRQGLPFPTVVDIENFNANSTTTTTTTTTSIVTPPHTVTTNLTADINDNDEKTMMSSNSTTTTNNDGDDNGGGDANDIASLLKKAETESSQMLVNMSETEIRDAQQELLSSLSPMVLQLLKNRQTRSKKSRAAAAAASSSTIEDFEAKKLEWTEDVNAANEDTDPRSVLRFDFDGNLIAPRADNDIDPTIGLHHHGDQGNWFFVFNGEIYLLE